MSSEDQTQMPTVDQPAKKKWPNPLKALLRLSLRAQLLILGGVFLVVLLILNKDEKKPVKPAPVAATATVEGSTATPAAIELPAQPAKPAQRLPESTPTDLELATLSQKKATAIGQQKDEFDRRVPDATVSMAKPAGPDEEPEPVEDDDGPKPAGAPYSPKPRRNNAAIEVMGIVSPVQIPAGTTAPGTSTQMAQAGGQITAPAPELKKFAPFGRLVKCKMVNTLDSLVPENSPVIAIVTEDVSWNGQVIVPVNTEVFAYVNGTPKVDARGVGRLFDTGEWVMVLPKQTGGKNGREWRVRGRALDRRELVMEDQGRVRAWGLDDMAPGLIGYTISTLDNEEIKLFVTAFLGTAAAAIGETLQEREGVEGSTTGATQPKATLKNAGLSAFGSGVSGVMTASADRIAEEIGKRGFYVRVPAGKEFYLFVEETLDPSVARVGLNLRDTNEKTKQ